MLIPTLLLAAFAFYLFLSTASIRDFGDHWFYLHFIRHYLDFPLDPALNPLVGQGATTGTLSRAATNGWWVLIALVVQVSGQPLLDAYWFWLPPILMGVSLVTFYALAWELFENHRAALTAVLFQLILYLTSISSHDWIGQGFFTRIAEDKYLVWLVLLPVSLLLLLRYLKSDEWQTLLILGLSVAAIAITHPFGLLQFAFAAACLALVYLPMNCRHMSRLQTAVLLAPILLFLIIPIIQQLLPSAITLTQFYPTEIQTPPNDTHLMLLSAKSQRYMLHPHLIFHPLILLAFLLSPFLLFRLKQSTIAQFLLATSILPILLLYNPITAPILGRFLSPLLLWRITWIVPTSLLLAYISSKIEYLPTSKYTKYQLPGAGLTGLAIVILVIILSPYIVDGIDLLKDYKTRTVTSDQQALLNLLCEKDSVNGVLVSDPLLNTLIPSCAPKVSLLTYRIFQSRPTAAEEIDQFFNSRLVSQSSITFLDSWQANYIILPNQAPIVDQISRLPELFSLDYANKSFSLYEYKPSYHPIVAGNEAFIRGNLETAVSLYSQTEENLALADYGLGLAKMAEGNHVSAESHFLRAISHDPAFPSPYLSLAAYYRLEGRSNDAQSLLSQALVHIPDNRLIHETLGDIYLEFGNETAAIEQFQQAIPTTTNEADKQLALALLYKEKGLTQPAFTSYQAVIQEESDLQMLAGGPAFWSGWSRSLTFDRRPDRLATAYREMGLLYERRGQLGPAEYTFRQIIELLPTRESSYEPLVDFYIRTGRQNETLTVYEEAASIHFHLSWPYRRLAAAYFDQYEKSNDETVFLNQAVTNLEKALEIEPENVEANQLLAQVYELQGQQGQAEAFLKKTAEKFKFAAWPLINLAHIYLADNNFPAAETALLEAIDRQPGDQTAYNLLAEAHLNRGETAAAIQLYREAIANNENRAWPCLGLGNAYLAAGQHEQALASLKDGLSKEPDNAAVHSTLANIYRWNAGDPAAAVSHFQQSLLLNPDQPDTLMGLASTLISLGRVEEGMTYLENALTLAPQSGSNFQQAGDIMWQLGRVEEAEGYYRQSLELDRQNAFAHLGLTRIYRQQEKYELALEEAQLAIQYSESVHATGPAEMEQAQIYLALGRPEQALPHILAAINAIPNDPWFQATAGDFYHYRQDDPAQAVPYYEKAAELAPQQAILQAALGTALYDASQIHEAVPIMETALELAGTDAAVFLRIGSVLNKYGDWERLVTFYETAVANGIENTEIFTQLGLAYSALGQDEKAQVQYEKAAALEENEQ